MWREFKAFLLKQNLLALALAVVVGSATNSVVQAIVDGFIMPIIGLATPGAGWRQWRIPLGPSLAERLSGGGADSVAAAASAAASTAGAAGVAGTGEAQNALLIGEFLAALLNFAIVAFVAWQITKLILKPKPADQAATRPCPYCRQQIDALATRCAYCTSELEAARAA